MELMREKCLLTCRDSGYLPPFLLNRKLEAEEVRFVLPQKVQVIEYYSLSDGCRRVYEDGDGLAGYGEKLILPPWEVSYYNLFINGVLQPPDAYSVEAGRLILKTEDVPIANATIILQMIKV